MSWIPSPTYAQTQSGTMTRAPACLYTLFAGKSSSPKVSACIPPICATPPTPLGPALQCLLVFTLLTHSLTQEQCYIREFSLLKPMSHYEAGPCAQFRCEEDAHLRQMLVSEESCERGRSPGLAPFVLRSVESY